MRKSKTTRDRTHSDKKYSDHAPTIAYRITLDEKALLEMLALPNETIHKVAYRLLKESLAKL